MEKGITTCKRDRTGNVPSLTEGTKVIKNTQCLIKFHLRAVASVIAVLAVQIAGLRDVPLKRERW